MSELPVTDQKSQILSGVVKTLLDDLRSGAGDRDRRRQVEEWMRTLAEKYPEFHIETGLRDYYLAEAERLRGDFTKSSGAFIWVWTLIALGVCAVFSFILSAHGLWKLQRGLPGKPELESR